MSYSKIELTSPLTGLSNLWLLAWVSLYYNFIQFTVKVFQIDLIHKSYGLLKSFYKVSYHQGACRPWKKRSYPYTTCHCGIYRFFNRNSHCSGCDWSLLFSGHQLSFVYISKSMQPWAGSERGSHVPYNNNKLYFKRETQLVFTNLTSLEWIRLN